MAAEPREVVGSRDARELVDHRPPGVERLELMLCEVTDSHVVTDAALAAVEAKGAGEDPEQRGLPCTVRPHEREPIATANHEIDPGVDRRVAVRLVHGFESEDDVAGTFRFGDPQPHPTSRFGRDLDPLDLLERLHAALDLPRFRCLVAEAFDEAFDLGDFAVLTALSRQELLAALLPLDQVAIVVGLVEGEAACVEFGDSTHVPAQEGPVVRDHDRCSREARERLLEPFDRGKIEMVRRLVEEQHVRLREQELGELDTHEPAATERPERPLAVRGIEAEPGEDAFDARFALEASAVLEERSRAVVALGDLRRNVGSLPAECGDLLLEASDLALELSESRLHGRDFLAHRALARGIDLLAEHSDPDPAGRAHLPRVGRLVSGGDAEQRGLAGAVGSDEPDAVSGANVERDVGKEGPVAHVPREPFEAEPHRGESSVRVRRGAARSPSRRRGKVRSDPLLERGFELVAERRETRKSARTSSGVTGTQPECPSGR